MAAQLRSPAPSEAAAVPLPPSAAGSAPGATATRVRLWLEEEGLVCLVLAVLVWRLGSNLPEQVLSDTWLGLLAGREVVQHGLPATDPFTVWAHGRDWVDQQWLAQLAFYGLYALGGLKLLGLVHMLLVTAAIVAALALARARGASSRAVAWIGAPTVFLVALGAWNVRPQSLVYPLFMAVLWLVTADARAPSRRVLLVFPLLVLWGNLHGSAVLGASLVALLGLLGLRRGRAGRARAGLLVAAPWLCLFASPYGLSLGGYYHDVLLNPALGRFVVEWDSTKPGILTAPFYLLALGGLWLIGRHGARLTTYEKAVFAFTALGGFLAFRNLVWFALVAAALLPLALEEALPPAPLSERLRRVNLAVGAASVVAILASPVLAAGHGPSWFTRHYPDSAAAAAVAGTRADPSARVYANELFADWLLFTRPELRGRVAYDARFELLPRYRLRQAFDFRTRSGDWRRAARGYDVVVLQGAVEGGTKRALLADAGTCVAHRGGGVVVLARGLASGACA
jgi:hypothetical protein